MFVVPESRRLVHAGQRFGTLTVCGVPFYAVKSFQHAVCQCDCGRVLIVTIPNLRRAESCGCVAQARSAARSRKHGGFGTSIYNVWSSMKCRCYTTKHKAFHWYGGRGIRVCDEWQTFEPFRDWAISNGYSVGSGLSLDRIDTNGNYEPSNCRWATMKQQQDNRRNTIYVTAFGETRTVTQWATDPRCKVTAATVKKRLIRGWPGESAISLPPQAFTFRLNKCG